MTPEALAALNVRTMTVPAPFTAAEFAALLNAPGVFVLGDALGFALGRVAADEAELLTIAVAPEAQRKGNARRLLAGFEREAAKRGAAEVFLEVEAGNVPALALYAGAGWRRIGRRRGYYAHAGGRRSDALVLMKSLFKSA